MTNGITTILAGYDGTRSAERALERAAEFANAFGAKVVVVSVLPPQPVATPAFSLAPYYAYGSDTVTGEPQADEAIWRQHRERVQELFSAAGIEVDFTGVLGLPDDQLVQLAEEQQADLIVVGTREPSFFERLFGGSVSEGVARHARCDVLIVHPRGADD